MQTVAHNMAFCMQPYQTPSPFWYESLVEAMTSLASKPVSTGMNTVDA